MQDELRPKEIRFFQIGVCIGAHAGPGVTGIICLKINNIFWVTLFIFLLN